MKPGPVTNGYAYIVFSKTIKEVVSADEKVALDKKDGKATYHSNHLKAGLKFNLKKNEELLVKVGISNVSYDGAEKNLQTELPG